MDPQATIIDLSLSADSIVNKYTGRSSDSFEKILISEVSTVNENIKRRYKKFQFYKNLPKDVQREFHLKCLPINAKAALKIIGLCASIFAGAGAVVGAIVGNFPGAAAGGCVGFVGGTVTGVGISYHRGLLSLEDEKMILIMVKENPEYLRLKEIKTKDQYRLFANCISNYSDLLKEEEFKQLENLICPITQWIPQVPVFSPYDVDRLHPFEKEAIEQHLDAANAAYQKAVDEHAKQATIDNYRNNICPFRGKPFTKNELVYDIAYCKKAIELLEKVQTALEERIKASDDPILKEAIDLLIKSYRSTFKQVTQSTVDRFSKDAFKLGKEYSYVKQLCELFLEGFGRV